MASGTEPSAVVTLERRGRLLLIALNRPDKGNAMNMQLITELAHAYTEFEDDDDAWVAVVHGAGDHLTTGLDLVDLAPHLNSLDSLYDEQVVDPWGLRGRPRSKPVVAVATGWVITAGIELLLAADVRVAAADARFAQMEVSRGILPFGGATIRMPGEAGWGNAMRWILTGDEFDAPEALRIGVVQEVVAPEEALRRGIEIAERIAAQAPLAVRAAIASARLALTSPRSAIDELSTQLQRLAGTEDALEGVVSFMERRHANFAGR
jgi:enoyl-CoA hydratase